jgi:hypothetical protein
MSVRARRGEAPRSSPAKSVAFVSVLSGMHSASFRVAALRAARLDERIQERGPAAHNQP